MKAALTNILAPTDFSALSENALSTAIAMCKRHGATLHLVHVIDERYLIAPRGSRNTAAHLRPGTEESEWEKLSALKDKIAAKHDITVTAHLKTGHPAEWIGETAQDLGCGIIVMGTHGTSGLREFFIGSTAYAVIRHTSIPVLTIPGKKKILEFKKILFPVRLSKGIVEKYDFIDPVIKKNNAQLIIAGLSRRGEQFALDPLDKEVRELGKLLKKRAVKFRSKQFVCKNYARKVLEIAKKEKADLIVINASLDYNWKQFFIGPYTQQVVNHSSVPVLSYRNSPATPE